MSLVLTKKDQEKLALKTMKDTGKCFVCVLMSDGRHRAWYTAYATNSKEQAENWFRNQNGLSRVYHVSGERVTCLRAK